MIRFKIQECGSQSIYQFKSDPWLLKVSWFDFQSYKDPLKIFMSHYSTKPTTFVLAGWKNNLANPDIIYIKVKLCENVGKILRKHLLIFMFRRWRDMWTFLNTKYIPLPGFHSPTTKKVETGKWRCLYCSLYFFCIFSYI